MKELYEVLREIDYVSNIKEIKSLTPDKYNIQESIDKYLNKGMDKYQAMQMVKDSLLAKYKSMDP